MSDLDTVFYRYPPRALVGDYIRSGVGTTFGLLIVASNPNSPWVLGIFGILTAAFAVFGLRTLRQQMTQVAVTPEAVFVKHIGTRELPWQALQQVKLRFYGTRRQARGERVSGGGFLELTLRGNGKKLKFDSNLMGFKDVAWHAARAARENNLSLDPTTAGNLLDIGVDADSETPRPRPLDALQL
ncbi:hypothetical protein [Algihabitans albus]|uniref:hypothetical protein n=1 Tax=Algihabitans albus TaxID=2164067 RepID=UPI000E5D8C0A|nr:hypothetical protein [Algihabitans albus]